MPTDHPLPDQPVLTACGGRMDDPERYPSALFQGRRVYFCTRACLRVFQSDPERFMAGEIEHPLEEDGSLLKERP